MGFRITIWINQNERLVYIWSGFCDAKRNSWFFGVCALGLFRVFRIEVCLWNYGVRDLTGLINLQHQWAINSIIYMEETTACLIVITKCVINFGDENLLLFSFIL